MDTINRDFLLNSPLLELVSEADRIRKEKIEPKIDLCSIINAKSGRCSEDCKYCAQSGRHQTNVEVYPMVSVDKIISAAEEARNNGASKLGIVTSGNKLTEQEMATIIEATKHIVKEVGIGVCGSLGALSVEQLKVLREAGMSRYHHNIETSRNHYGKIVSTHTFDDRLKTIKAAKEAGMTVCSGGIIGMGESWDDRIDMALTLKELDVDSVPLNILIPIEGTPLENIGLMPSLDVIRTIAIFRLILQDKSIRVIAGRESVLKDYQGLAFMAGANGMMIGGYLTVRGRSVEDDRRLVKEIEESWLK